MTSQYTLPSPFTRAPTPLVHGDRNNANYQIKPSSQFDREGSLHQTSRYCHPADALRNVFDIPIHPKREQRQSRSVIFHEIMELVPERVVDVVKERHISLEDAKRSLRTIIEGYADSEQVELWVAKMSHDEQSVEVRIKESDELSTRVYIVERMRDVKMDC